LKEKTLKPSQGFILNLGVEMKSVDRIDIKKKWPIPPAVKMILMLAVILGIV